MKNLVRSTSIAFATLWSVATAVSAAPLANPLLAFLSTSCSAAELGQVTEVRVLDFKQANVIFKRGKAPQDAKQGDVYIQIFATSKAVQKDYSMNKVERAPSRTESAELVGKLQCTYEGG